MLISTLNQPAVGTTLESCDINEVQQKSEALKFRVNFARKVKK